MRKFPHMVNYTMCMQYAHVFEKQQASGLYFILCPLMLKTFSLWDIIAYFLRSSCHIGDYISAIIIICFQICVMITLLCYLQLKAKMAFDISSVVLDAVSCMSR